MRTSLFQKLRLRPDGTENTQVNSEKITSHVMIRICAHFTSAHQQGSPRPRRDLDKERLLTDREHVLGPVSPGFFTCVASLNLQGSSEGSLRASLCLSFFFLLFRAAPTAYGSSQAKGRIGATAASLHHSHRISGSEQHLRPTPQLRATQDP